MFDIDKKIWEPISTFHARLGDVVETVIDRAGKKREKRLEDFCPGAMLTAIDGFIATYGPSIKLEEKRSAVDAEVAREQAVQHETYLLASEICYQIMTDTARVQTLRDSLEPRIGDNAEEHASNLKKMRERVTQYDGVIKGANVTIRLLDRHHPDKVQKQLDAHAVATKAIETLRASVDSQHGEVTELRVPGRKLQKKINKIIENVFDGAPRKTWLEYGYTERDTPRPEPKETAADGKGSDTPKDGSSTPAAGGTPT